MSFTIIFLIFAICKKLGPAFLSFIQVTHLLFEWISCWKPWWCSPPLPPDVIFLGFDRD